MKKLLLFITIVLWICYPKIGISQKYRNKEISLISFSVSLHPEIKAYLEKLQSHIKPCKNPKSDKIICIIKEQTWFSFSDKLQSEVGMIILPLNTYGDNFDYDVYGFPDASINKAIKKGESKYYMKLELFIWPDQYQGVGYKKQSVTKGKPAELQPGQIRPKVTLNMISYSENGVLPIDKYTGIAIAPDAFDIEPYVLDGLINSNSHDDLTTIMSLINEAISELAINIYAE